MSEHAWVLENIASYTADGLDAVERERLEQHIAECESCKAALEKVQALDQQLESVFAEVRPAAALEDRMIGLLRNRQVGPSRIRRFRSSPIGKVAMAAAAVLLLGVVGAGMNGVIEDGELPFPGLSANRVAGMNNLKQFGLAMHSAATSYAGVPGSSAAAVSTLEFGDSQSTGNLPDANAMADETRRLALGNLADTDKDAIPIPNDFNRNAVRQELSNGRFTPLDANTKPAAAEQAGNTKPSSNLASDTASVAAAAVKLAEARVQASYEAFLRDKKLYDSPGRPATSMEEARQTWTDHLRAKHELDLVRALAAGQGKRETGQPLAPSSDQDKAAKNEGSNYYTFRDERPTNTILFVRPSTGIEIVGNEVTKQTVTKQILATAPALGLSAGDAKSQGEGRLGGEQKSEPKPKPEQEAPPPATPRKIIIRTGDIEFEVDSFDSAVATLTKLVGAIQNGFVATVNSEKLPNGKVRGSVVVRVPPEHLDGFVLDLRKELGKAGELKGLRIGSQDITKQYTDLESRLRAARAMEERLLQIIKTGKGEIKDLLQAEKELGVWRTKIEEMEGELRYYANQVALSTLTITLYEKEIRSPYSLIETERVQMGIEVEEVDKALQAALAIVAEAKGRVAKSELKQQAAGQFNAILQFEVAPESAGPVRDQLKQLGNVARLEIDRAQQAEGGTGRPQDAKSKRNDTQFAVSLYNLANAEPRETVNLSLACPDAESAYKAILARVQKANGQIVTSNLDHQRNDQSKGSIQFAVKSAEADAVLADLKAQGEVMSLRVTENPNAQNVTRSKRGFLVQLWALGTVRPREETTIQLATKDVPAGYRALQDAVVKAKGRILGANLNEQDKQNITAKLDLDIRRSEEAALSEAMKKIGGIYSRTVTRAQDSEQVLDSKIILRVTLTDLAQIPPRETTTLGIEVPNVEQKAIDLVALAKENGARNIRPEFSRLRDGQVTARLIFDIPLTAAPTVLSKIRSAGLLRVERSVRNEQVPEGDLARARVEVTVSNDLIIASDEGLWPQLRKGLSNSLKAIFFSLSWVIFGLLFILPWVLVFYAGYRIVLRFRPRPTSNPTVP